MKTERLFLMCLYVDGHTQLVHVECLLAHSWYTVSTQKISIAFISITNIAITEFLVLPFALVFPS